MTINETCPDQAASAAPRSDSRDRASSDLHLDAPARRFLITVAAGFALLRLWAAFVLPFTDTTEARYAEIARKMVETGNWLTPQFDYGVPFWGKPPLHTWLAAGGMQLFGISEAAARLPILLTALAVLALVWVWARAMIGRNAALVSCVVLASMAMFFGASAFVMTDMPMVLGTTLVMIGFWNATCNGGNRRWGHAMFLGLAIGLLAKGPVAAVLCAIPLALWLILTRSWPLLRRLPWRGGSAMMLVLVLPWYGAAEIATPGFLRYFLIGEHVQRFLIPEWQGDLYGTGHEQAKGMIWWFWILAALPWSPALALLIARPRAIAAAFGQDNAGWLAYLLLWALAPMLLFTPASNILAAYVLPGLPAAAILLSALAIHGFGTQPPRALRLGFASAVLIIFALSLALTGLARFAPQVLALKTDGDLVSVAAKARPGGALYTLGRRSYSAEFYSQGKARPIKPGDFAARAAQDPGAAFLLPHAMANEARHLGLSQAGANRRHMLFITPPANEAE